MTKLGLRRFAVLPESETTMDQDTATVTDDLMEDDIETIGDYHRMAAHHFAAASKHHLAAAQADDDGNEEAITRHALLAYRHQLNGVQCAEIANMESDSLEDEFDAPLAHEEV